jgi:DNA-binding CsgD family transcriptional regulator
VEALLLDRDAELEALERQLRDVRAGAGRVVVVEGPAGIGKSSLLRAAARTGEAHGIAVLRARGDPLGQDAVWGIARQLFEPLRSRPDWHELTSGAAALALRALDPQAPEPAPAADAVHAAVHGLVWLSYTLAERGPALLVVDDVHWADAASLRWLAQLARRLDEQPLGVLCAVRTGEPPGERDLLAELVAAVTEPALRPQPLGPVAAEALVADRLPDAGPAFAHACHAVTAGNPFLLRALLAHLAAERITPDDATAERLSAFGPDQVARTVERQLARLPDGATGIARALAVLGREAPLRHAARLSRLDAEHAAHACDALRAAGLVHGDAEIAFAHPLIAAALYSSLGPGERALWHADAARMLSDERADPERIALHLLRTDGNADEATVAALRAAAAGATARGAPESAVGFLRRALAEPPLDPEAAAAVRLELGLARAAHMQPDAPALLHDAVELATSPAQRIAHALQGARALGLAGYFPDALRLCRRGLDDAASAPGEDRERLEAELSLNEAIQAATVQESRRRVAAARERPGALGLWRVNAAWEAMADGCPTTEVDALLAPALDEGVFDREVGSLLPTAATLILIAEDDLDAAIARCGELIDLARPRGWRIALAHGSFMRAMALVRAGRIRDAVTDARLGFEFKRAHSPAPALLWALSALVDALTEAGEPEAADAALAAVDQLGDPPAGAYASPLLLQSRARLRLSRHRCDDAHRDVQAAAERWRELGTQHPVIASWRVDAAEALCALGDPTEAGRLADEHLRLAERVGTPAPAAAGLRARARVAEGTERIELLERAAALTAGSQARLEHTRALVDLGAALRRVNRRAEAREPLRRALDLGERHGMVLLARRARAELQAAGARPRRPALTGPDALTPTEHRVATLAAAGNSNRDIAQQLFVTRRTVETHLTHAFQKLDITNRDQLAACLDERASEVAVGV